MSKKARKDIIKLIAAGIEFDILKEGKSSPEDSSKFESLVKENAATMLETYEKSVSPDFWYGAWQGVAGNFMYHLSQFQHFIYLTPPLHLTG